MARLPKWPKAPKASASLEAWQRYAQRCREVASKRKAIKAKPQKIQAIKTAVSKLK